MYESYFGFSTTPFNLNPDPGFYFESKGHGHALSYLKFGVYQGEGFVVVTGEIGAGKTTLVRTLLSGVDPKEVVAAQIVSTQLDAGDLLRSVALAFGIAPKNLSKAELIATIEAFLTDLVLQKKRALLVVDEAQNLNLAAIEELRMLSNFQLGNHALLQSFLIGQPELRALLTSKPMEQLRQRVIASCHLGPMDRRETEAYVRHRLGVVGWTDRPSFDTAAFDQIFEWTGGVPRRVNLLCNRLLLAAFLQSRMDIDGPLVRAIAQEVLSEVGEAPEPEAELAGALAVAPATAVEHRLPDRVGEPDRPLLLVAGSRSDDVKLTALMRTLRQRKGLPPVAYLRLGKPELFALDDPLLRAVGAEDCERTIALTAVSAATRLAQALQELDAVVDARQPSAVVVAGSGDVALATAIVCQRRGVRLVHADAGRRTGVAALDVNASMIEQVAELYYAADKSATDTLARAGVQKARTLTAGSLMADAARLCEGDGRALIERLAVQDEAVQGLDAAKQRYGLVLASRAFEDASAEELAENVSLVRQVALDVPLLWPVGLATRERLAGSGLRPLVDDARVAMFDAPAFPDVIALARGASLVLTDSTNVQSACAHLRVACLRIDQDQQATGRPAGSRATDPHAALTLPDVKKVGAGSFKTAAPSRELDGHASERIAEHLTEWLLSTALVEQLVRS